MEALIGRTRKSKKHAADELEKKADLAFLERMKKRKTLIGKERPDRPVSQVLRPRAFWPCGVVRSGFP